MSNVSNEITEMMADVLFKTFCENYRGLCSLVNRLPVHNKMKELIISHFDTGFLWGKEAFEVIQSSAKQLSANSSFEASDFGLASNSLSENEVSNG